MTALRFLSILLFLFVLAGGKQVGAVSKSQTEAGFSVECTNCGRGPDQTENLVNLTECLNKMLSAECQNVPKEHRMTCEEDTSFRDYAKGAGQSLLSCGEYLMDSTEFLLELLWTAVKFSTDMVFDPEAGKEAAEYFSSIKNYLAIEFFKSYRSAKGTKTEKLLKTIADLAGDSLGSLLSWIKNFIHEQYSSFICYNGTAQTAILCSVVAGMAIPLPGGSVFSAISVGLKTGQLSLKTTNLLKKTVDSSMSGFKNNSIRSKGGRLSGKKLKSAADRAYRDISQRILSASKNMPKAVQNEVSLLFSKSNTPALKSKLKDAIRTTFQSGNISAAALVLTVAGALTSYRIFLSKQTTEFVTKEVADTMTTAYTKELLEEEQPPLSIPSTVP